MQQPPYVHQGPQEQPLGEDPVRGPLQLLALGIALSIVQSLYDLVFVTFGFLSSSLGRVTTPLGHLLMLLAPALMLAGAVQLTLPKRPGQTAMMVGVLGVLGGTVFAFGAPLLSSFGLWLWRLAAFGGAVADSAAIVGLAFGLDALGKSRGRASLGLKTGATCAAGALFLFTVSMSVFGVGDFIMFLGVLLAVVESGLLLALAVRVMGQGAPVADLVMGDPSAYRGPQAGYGMQQAAVVPGSVALGFLAGFFGGCIGLGLVLAFAKGPATKRGAGIGFACQTVVGIGLRAAAH